MGAPAAPLATGSFRSGSEAPGRLAMMVGHTAKWNSDVARRCSLSLALADLELAVATDAATVALSIGPAALSA